jgi:hypothetical protein
MRMHVLTLLLLLQLLSPLQVMLEEAITAAQAGVVHRFKEIAAERDLADSSDDEDNTNINNTNACTQREPALAVLTGTLGGTTSTARRTARAGTPAGAVTSAAVSTAGVTAAVTGDDGMAELAERARVAGALGVAAAQEGLAAAKRGILTRGLSVLSATLNLHEDADDDAAAVAEHNAQLIAAAGTTATTSVTTAGGAGAGVAGGAMVSVRDGSSAVFNARTDRGSLASGRYGGTVDSSEADEYAAAAAAELQAERQYLAEQGQFPLHLYRSGEGLQERAFRRFLRIHCVESSELVTRLRSLDPAMTALKTDELLLELPSKALLLRYAAWWLQHNAHHFYTSSSATSSGSSGEADVSATSNNAIALAGLQCAPHPAALAALATDLRQQFRLTRGAHAVASALAGMLAADSELGVSPRALRWDRAAPDALLRSTACSDLAAGVTAARAEARKIVGTAPTAANGGSGDGASPALQEALRVRYKVVAEATAAIAKQQRRLQLAECELREVQKRLLFSDVARHALGTTSAALADSSGSGSAAAVKITAEHRQDWSRRYATAAAAPENTAAEIEVTTTLMCHNCLEYCSCVSRSNDDFLKELCTHAEQHKCQHCCGL